MSHYGKCKHGIYLDGCRECFPLPELTKVGEELIQELVECFNEDKEMTANELASQVEDWEYEIGTVFSKKVSTMLRQQQAELDAFKLQYYNTGYSLQLRDKDETIKQQAKEIAMLKQIIDANNLQSDIGQFKKASKK